MEIPDLSLNSTFSVPLFEHQEEVCPSPVMCKYTIYSYDCGHPAEDHVDSGTCPEYQRTGVHCDRDNLTNKDRVKVKNKDRNGICENCLRKGRENDEIERMQREIEKARELSLADAKAQEEDMRRAEQRAREESLAEAEKRKADHEVRIKELERESAEEYARVMRQREDDDFEFMLRKSREEAELAAQQKETELMQQAFLESLKIDPSARHYEDEVITKGVKDLGDGLMEKWIEIKRTSRETVSESSSTPIPPPPGPAPKPVKRAPRHPPVEKSIPKTVDYTMRAMGEQNIGRFKVGTRHQPIHPSQDIKEPTASKSPMMSNSPAPFARLGGTITPDVPAMREARGPGIQVPSAQDARAGLRRTTGPRRQLPPRDQPDVDPKLKAAMAKRREWEETEETASNVSATSITPSQSASNIQTRVSTPTTSTIGGPSTAREGSLASTVTGASEEAWGEPDAKALKAKRISKLDFDKYRKTGWGGE